MPLGFDWLKLDSSQSGRASSSLTRFGTLISLHAEQRIVAGVVSLSPSLCSRPMVMVGGNVEMGEWTTRPG